jgi:DNA-directed RNA polymerase I, II, and III subunit RPABC3
MEVTLDYASELIDFAKGNHIVICLARSLQLDPTSLMSDSGAKEAKREMWRGGEQGLAQEYDYVMYGKVS